MANEEGEKTGAAGPIGYLAGEFVKAGAVGGDGECCLHGNGSTSRYLRSRVSIHQG